MNTVLYFNIQGEIGGLRGRQVEDLRRTSDLVQMCFIVEFGDDFEF